MNESPDKIQVIRQWIQKAENDLRTAEHTLTLSEDCPFDTICFHAQQCSEKYLKALLVVHDVYFPKTHDLIALRNLVPKGIALELPLSELGRLSRYAATIRYPMDPEEISRETAEAAVEVANKARKEIRKVLPEKVLAT